MDACDSRFALDYVYPVAHAAYDEPWNSASLPLLAGFTQVGEILLTPASPSFMAAQGAAPSAGSQKLLASMLKPRGAPRPPAVAVAAAALPPALHPNVAVAVNDRFGWVCVDPSRARLIVAFRGTQTPEDWLHDVDFVSEPYRPIEGGGTVHQGFQHVYYAVRDNVLRLVKERCAGIREVLVTGHSLGGALATLALPDIVNFLRSQPEVPAGLKVLLYSLASPRAGHADFKTFFNAWLPCWRIVNTWDVVPSVPPELLGYAHVGMQSTVDSGFHLNAASNHVLDTGYLPGIETWNHHDHPTGAVLAAHLATAAEGRYVPPGVCD
ncbi:lipase family protein [Melittangium boletus]|uniref:lipase family protein n=1 Tax=Melittangium boletus TaxID=83453 RepID=UPI003DA60D6D